MPISNWPVADRPREKLLLKGEAMLTDAELIALMLESGANGVSALDLAKNLLTKFGDLRKLADVSKHQLLAYNGIGPAKYARIRAALEFAKRCQGPRFEVNALLNSTDLTQAFLTQQMRHLEHEMFACLFLTNHLHLIAYEPLFRGTINHTNIYPREIVKVGLSHNAAKVILAHNHPSGDPEPSLADLEITKIIAVALDLVEIKVLDHVIIGSTCNYSFAENGLAMV